MAFGSARNLPCRINLVELEFLPKDMEKTVFDPVFKQPVRTKKRKEPVKIKGQPNFGSRQKKAVDALVQSLSLNWNTPGDITNTFGYILFRKKEIDESGYTPAKGDLLIKYAGYDPPDGTEWIVEEFRPESPLRGKPLLFIAEIRPNRNKR